MIKKSDNGVAEAPPGNAVASPPHSSESLEELIGKLLHTCYAEVSAFSQRERDAQERQRAALEDMALQVKRHFRSVENRSENLQTIMSRLNMQSNLLAEKFEGLSHSLIRSRVEEPFLRDLLETLQALSEDDQSAESSEARYIIEQALERRDFETVCPVIGDAFDCKHHEAIGRIPTRKENQDGHIAEVRRCGLTKNGKNHIPARVCVYAFEPVSSNSQIAKS